MKKTIVILFTFALVVISCNQPTRNEVKTFDKGVIINGVRWATRNVDAPGTFAEFPESPGMLFQWNRRKGWNAVDEEMWGWNWNNLSERTEWYAENDPCPEGWRVSTREELQSLVDAGSEWTTQNGVNGRRFGTYPHQLFLPAAGSRNIGGCLQDVGVSGDYWSSSAKFDCQALALSFDRNWAGAGKRNVRNKANGFSIRCVAKK